MMKRKEILILVFFSALMIRLVFYFLIRDTLFLSYHLVPGLDMQTLLRFSEWGPGGSGFPPFFTWHRVLIFLLWKIGGATHHVLWLFVIQTLTGALGAAALTDLSLMLTGKRKTSLCAGLIMAAALPPLIYEFSVLQECFSVNFLIFAIWASLRAKQKHYSVKYALAAGIFWSAALAGRPAAILAAGAGFLLLLPELRRKSSRRGAALLLGTILFLLAAASVFNKVNGWPCTPFYHVLPYTVAYNAGSDAAQGKTFSPGIWHSAGKAMKRVPSLFSPLELPENQNLYFWRTKSPFLFLFPGPGLLLAFSLSGILLLLAGKKRKKALLPLGVIFLLAMPLCAREAIGRYRLMLWPWLILAGSFGWGYCRRALPEHTKAAEITAASSLALMILLSSWQCRRYLRLSDYHAWALATAGRDGHGESSLAAFSDLWEKSGHGADTAFRAYAGEALRCDRPDLVQQTVAEAVETGKVEKNLIVYYYGALFIRANDAPHVKALYTAIDKEKLPPDLRQSVAEILAETERILRQRKGNSGVPAAGDAHQQQ